VARLRSELIAFLTPQQSNGPNPLLVSCPFSVIYLWLFLKSNDFFNEVFDEPCAMDFFLWSSEGCTDTTCKCMFVKHLNLCSLDIYR
jgi:hypothetical protein